MIDLSLKRIDRSATYRETPGLVHIQGVRAMLSLQPRLSLEIPSSPSRSLSFRRLRRPTPLPTLHRQFDQGRLIERLLSIFSPRQR